MPLPWNSKEARSRAQSAPEIKPLSIKVPHQVQPVKEESITEKPESEIMSLKNNILDISTNSNISSPVTSSSITHSADQSFGKY